MEVAVSPSHYNLTRNMVELRVTLAVEIRREFGSEDPSHAAIGVS
jgi:hypothetical protein